MRGQAGLFDIDERLREMSAKGDDPERLNAIVDLEAFRPDLARALPRSDGRKGGRPLRENSADDQASPYAQSSYRKQSESKVP
jgi:hypothetical protein